MPQMDQMTWKSWERASSNSVFNAMTVLLVTVLPPPNVLFSILDGDYLDSVISCSHLPFMLTASIAVFACYPNLYVFALPYHPRCTGTSCARGGKNNTRQCARICGFCVCRECWLTYLRLCSMTENDGVFLNL